MNFISTIAPAPVDLGLPETFPSWRPMQLRAVDDAYYAFTRGTTHVAQMLACGAGKSLSNVAQCLIAGRGAYLTATNALLEQLHDEFESIGAVIIKGRSNYPCAWGSSGNVTCEDGRHLGCKAHKDGACPYVNALNVAKDSSLVLTNYDYWIAIHKHGEGLGVFDILVCDEASAAVDKICDAMAIEITRLDLGRANLRPPETATAPEGTDIDGWKAWAADACKHVKTLVNASAARLKVADTAGSRAVQEHKALAGLADNLEALVNATGTWVADFAYHEDANGHRTVVGWRFDPLWPSDFTQELLYRGVPRVLMTSATMTRKTCTLMGMPEESLAYFEYPAVFDPRRSPVYWLKSDARVGKGMSEYDEGAWVRTLDYLLRTYPSFKGLVHSVSYTWSKMLFRLSNERQRLVYHASWNTQQKLDEFRAKAPDSGAWFLSPAVVSGYDFAYDAARINVIAKIPLKDGRAKIMKARIKADPDYSDWLTAQDVMQEVGRVMRQPDDWGMSIVIDDHWAWWFWKAKKKGLFARWFVQLWEAGGAVTSPPDVPKGCK